MTPGLYLTRTTFDQYDNAAEFDQEFWRHDALEMSIEVHADVAEGVRAGASRSA